MLEVRAPTVDGVPGLSDDRARELAAEILRRADYAHYRRPPTHLQELVDALAAWLRQIADWTPQWLVDLWARFGSWLEGMTKGALGDDAGVALLRLALALAVLGVLGVIAVRTVRELRARRGAQAALAPEAVLEGPRFVAEADGLARQGRFLEAAHRIQLASLQLLLRKRWLELERSDPNRTLRHRLADTRLPDALRQRFLALLDRLEGRWFRDRVEDRELYSEWRALHARIESLPESR